MPQFKKRPASQGISYYSSSMGKPIKPFPLEETTGVILLYIGDCPIQVEGIRKVSEETFEGAVRGIEPPCQKCDDVEIGQIVTFSEDEVFSASKE